MHLFDLKFLLSLVYWILRRCIWKLKEFKIKSFRLFSQNLELLIVRFVSQLRKDRSPFNLFWKKSQRLFPPRTSFPSSATGKVLVASLGYIIPKDLCWSSRFCDRDSWSWLNNFLKLFLLPALPPILMPLAESCWQLLGMLHSIAAESRNSQEGLTRLCFPYTCYEQRPHWAVQAALRHRHLKVS